MTTQPNHPNTRTPESLLQHKDSYLPDTWKEYTMEELGHIVAFFVKRSQQRTNARKMAKDLYDARNYVQMMVAHIEQHVLDLGTNMRSLRAAFTKGELAELAELAAEDEDEGETVASSVTTALNDAGLLDQNIKGLL